MKIHPVIPWSKRLLTGALCAAAVLASRPVRAQSTPLYQEVHAFNPSVAVNNASGSTSPDGQQPFAAVTFDSAGNAYGTTQSGGPNGQGNVWEVTTTGTYIDLHDFGGTVNAAGGGTVSDGANPYRSVTFDSAGNIWGTTLYGGADGVGTVWEINTSQNAYSVATSFGGWVWVGQWVWSYNGEYPFSGVTFDSSGNMYGTTFYGGLNGHGAVWEIPAGGSLTNIHSFGGTAPNASGSTSTDGYYSYAGVTVDGSGNIYGSTFYGGQYGGGMVWKISAGGMTYTDLHDFSGWDGYYVYGTVTLDASGNMYGEAVNGGTNGEGTIWQISTENVFTKLHDFGDWVMNPDGSWILDGAWPQDGVTFDKYGNLYGTTIGDGPYGVGNVWSMNSSLTTYTVLHNFGGSAQTPSGASVVDGANPQTGVSIDTAGNLWGTTQGGGPANEGTVWEIIPYVSSLTLTPSPVPGGTSVTGTVSLQGPAPAGGVAVIPWTNTSLLSVPASIVVPAGATSATFTVGTSAYFSTYSAGVGVNAFTSSATAHVLVDAPVLTSITLNPTSVQGGASSTGTITISSPAPSPSGLPIIVASSTSLVTVPSTVTIPAGQTCATFSIGTTAYSGDVNANIKATYSGASLLATLDVIAPQISTVTYSPASVPGGISSVGTVTLTSEAPSPGGITVTLTSNAPSIVSVPSSVNIAAGQTCATFTATTSTPASTTTVTIQAKNGSQTVNSSLSVVIPQISTATFSPSTVPGGTAGQGTITLTSAAPTPNGTTVTLTSNAPSIASVPSTVTITAGQTSTTFTATTTIPASTAAVTVQVKDGSQAVNAPLTVTAPQILAVTLSPTSVPGGTSSQGMVTLTSQAPTGGITVTLLSSSSALVSVPSSVTISAGQTTACFTATTYAPASTGTVNVQARLGSQAVTAQLTVTAPTLVSLTFPGPATGTGTITGTVTISGPAPAAGLVLTLVSNDPAVASVPATVTILGGQTTGTFTVTTTTPTATTSVNIKVQNGGSQSKTTALTVNP